MIGNEDPMSVRHAVTGIRDAYLRVKDEIDAVEDAALLPVNVDLQRIVTSTRGRLGRILELLDRVRLEAPGIDPCCFTKLEDYVLATAYTQGQYRATAPSSTALRALQLEAADYRQRLLVDATTLARRGQFDGAWLGQLSRVKGYEKTAFDLLMLYTQLRENWSKIQGRTALELVELERAGAIANELMLAVGIQRNNAELMDKVILNRRRAFTLLVRAYDQVRRTILFLRWNEGDGDRIAPSLYSGRRSSRPDKHSRQNACTTHPSVVRANPGATTEIPATMALRKADTPKRPNGTGPRTSRCTGLPVATSKADSPSAQRSGMAEPQAATAPPPRQSPVNDTTLLSLIDNNPFGT